MPYHPDPDLERFLATFSGPWPQDGEYAVYVIKNRTPRHYYVGMTMRLTRRLAEHWKASEKRWKRQRALLGCRWSVTHGVHRIVAVVPVDDAAEGYRLERDLIVHLHATVPRVRVGGWGRSRVGGRRMPLAWAVALYAPPS